MTVTMLREHGVASTATDRRLAGRARARRRAGTVVDRARPVQRRAVPGRGAGHRRPGDRAATGPTVTTQPGAQLDRCSPRWAPRSRRTPDGLQVTGGRHDRTARRRPRRRRRADPGARRAVRARRRPVAAAPGSRHLRGHETDRLAGARRGARRAVGAEVEQLPDGLVDRARPAARPALLDTYADHRMAHAGRRARAGRRRACAVDDRGASPRRCRTSPSSGPALLGRAGGSRPLSGRRRDSRPTRTTSGSGPAARARAPAPAPGPAHDDAVPGLVVAVDRGRMTVRVEGPDGGPSTSPPCGPASWAGTASSSATGCGIVGDTSGRPDTPRPHRAHRRADDVAAPHRRRHRPDRAGRRRQRRPAGHRHRAGRPASRAPASSTAAWSPPTPAASSRCCA